MTLEDSLRDHRLYALQRALETGNVSATCRELRISRTLFYRWKRNFEVYGPDGLHPRRTKAPPGSTLRGPGPSGAPGDRSRAVLDEHALHVRRAPP